MQFKIRLTFLQNKLAKNLKEKLNDRGIALFMVMMSLAVIGLLVTEFSYTSHLNYRIMGFLWYIIIGIVAGFAAGKIMRGGGFGLVVNLVLGIIGGVLGGWLFSILGIGVNDNSIIGSLITSTAGAIVLLWAVSLFKK